MGEMRVMRDQQLKARAQFIANVICRYCASTSLFISLDRRRAGGSGRPYAGRPYAGRP